MKNLIYILAWFYDDENVRTLGVFSSEKKAKSAMAKHVLKYKDTETKFKYNYDYLIFGTLFNETDLEFNPDEDEADRGPSMESWSYDKEDSLLHRINDETGVEEATLNPNDLV